MRATLALFILVGGLCTRTSDAETDALQSKVDAYIGEVGQMVAQALMPNLRSIASLGTSQKSFHSG